MRCGTIRYCMTWHDMIQLSKCTYAVFTSTRYEGDWLNDKKHGHGEEHYNDGGRFSGSHSLAMSIEISKAWAAIGTWIWVSDMFPGLRPGSQTDHPLYPSFHKVVWICLPEIHWHPLSWNFLFRLKCYILGCVDSGTISDRDLAVFSFCVFSMTRYALITLILEGLSPRLKLPELEHHFWPLTSMQTRLHSPQINLPTSRRVEVGSWEVQTSHAEATKREESLERALFVGRMALNTEQLGLDRRRRTHPDLHRWLMSCWDWNGKIKCFLLQKSVVIAVNASCFP